jgi:hypothetical protein
MDGVSLEGVSQWIPGRAAASRTLRSYLRSILMHTQWNSELNGSIARQMSEMGRHGISLPIGRYIESQL